MNPIPFTEARVIVEEQARLLLPVGTETVSLVEAHKRVLAEPVVADRDFPPFARATRDGYAVNSSALTKAPVRLRLAGEVKAGAAPSLSGGRLGTGEAAAIMTGAPLPIGADAVVMAEHVSLGSDGVTVTVERAAVPGENVVPKGSEAQAGDQLLIPGSRLDEAAIAVAAAVGRTTLRVFAKPQVAILATGDELVEVAAVPGPVQIRNSNSYSLAAQVSATGGRPLIMPAARDEFDELRRSVADGFEADLLLIAGGVSVGKYDFVEQVLADFHAEFFFTGALIQPGRPIVFGKCPLPEQLPALSGQSAGRQPSTGGLRLTTSDCRLFFGLPGNPVSTMVTFDLFVRPVVGALSGESVQSLIFLQARLKSALRIKAGLTRFLPARLSGEFEHAEVAPVPWQGSGDIVAVSKANCWLVVPPEREQIPAGEMVSVLQKFR
jgi:molybdopterin molybdotransferase